MQLVFVTRNKHKLQEVRQILGDIVSLLSLDDVNFNLEVPENEPTIEQNAIAKAKFFYDSTGRNCFADDTGLEVEALNGLPGVKSARFASDHDFKKNMLKVLELMKGKSNRRAQFRTIIALIIAGQLYTFEGIIKGQIAMQPKGNNGFGYDPIFIPDGYNKTFAQMTLYEKNKISHRSQAILKLKQFLLSNLNKLN